MAKKKKEKTLLEKIKISFDKAIMVNIIFNVILCIIGVLAYRNSLITLSVVGYVFGIYLLIYGVYEIYEFFLRDASPLFKFPIISGVVSIIVAIVLFINPYGILRGITIGLGVFLIAECLIKVIYALKFKKKNFGGWLLTIVTAGLILIFGIVLIINPLASIGVVKVVGIFTILYSILEICNLIMVYNQSKEIVKLFKDKE